MSKKKIIAVVGATGKQGGALARAILNDPSGDFSVRALTRDPNSGKAKELASLGAEVVSANIDDVESLKKAFAGAYGAFCVTFFWEHFLPQKEIDEARAMAKAAKDAGLEHVVWSTLEDTRKWMSLDDARMPTLMEKYKVPHMDAKGEADHEFTREGVPTTFLLTSFFWENFLGQGIRLAKGTDGELALTLPMADKKLPGIAVADIGKCAYGIFQKGGDLIGKTIGIAGEHLTGDQYAAAFAKALKRIVRYNYLPPGAYRGLKFPGADELGNMFQFKRDFEKSFCGARSVDFSRSLNPELQNFDTWLAANKDKIPLE